MSSPLLMPWSRTGVPAIEVAVRGGRSIFVVGAQVETDCAQTWKLAPKQQPETVAFKPDDRGQFYLCLQMLAALACCAVAASARADPYGANRRMET